MSEYIIFGIFMLLSIVMFWIAESKKSSQKKSLKDPKTKWVVEVAASTVWKADWELSNNHYHRREGETAVRLTRGKNEKHPIGTAKVIDDDFEQQLQKLVQVAEDRANILNAYDDGLL